MQSADPAGMTRVYVLYHVREGTDDPNVVDDGDVKMVGVYSTDDLAKAAVVRLGKQPGFSVAPEGFRIVSLVLDRDNWPEGLSISAAQPSKEVSGC